MDNYLDLIQRLRGVYTIPVNDGAGLLNGKDTFTRTFETTPISNEAADAIEELMDLCKNLWKTRRNLAYGPAGERAMLKTYPWLEEWRNEDE